MAMSPNGRLLAYAVRSAKQPLVCVHDLRSFKRIAQIELPALPAGNLAWAPDQSALASVIGNEIDRRIWILQINEGNALELPNPVNRSLPRGTLNWWDQNYLSISPSDAEPISVNLTTLRQDYLQLCPAFANVHEPDKRRIIRGSLDRLPLNTDWKLDACTVIRSVIPLPPGQSKRNWSIKGGHTLTMVHPALPVAMQLNCGDLREDSRITSSPDGSTIAISSNETITVYFMRETLRPVTQIEVEMPFATKAIKDPVWADRITTGMFCVYICAPLNNPLNGKTVGPDYAKVKGLAQILDWEGMTARFVVQTHHSQIELGDIVAVPHSWEAGSMLTWTDDFQGNWWSPVTPVPGDWPDKLASIESPQVMGLLSEPTTFRVIPIDDDAQAHKGKRQKPQPSPKEDLSVSPDDTTEVDVVTFIGLHHSKASQGDLQGVMAHYDEMVDFLDQGRIPKNRILETEMAHRQKWPKATERVISDMISRRFVAGWVTKYTIEFYNEGTHGNWQRGKADITLTLRPDGGRLLITDQKSRVYEVTGNN